MTKMLNATISESILKCAVIENHKREMAALPSDEELAKMYQLSERHEARMKKLFKRERRKEIRVKITVTIKYVAAVVIIGFIVLSGALLTNSSVRAAVGQTIIEWFDQFTRFSFEGASVPDEFEEWYPEYLPNGFVESNITPVGKSMKQIEFMNQENEYIYLEYWLAHESAIGVDNEHADFEIVWNNDIEYHVFTATSDEYNNNIIWQEDSSYVFHLRSTDVDVDELMLMATSVMKK